MERCYMSHFEWSHKSKLSINFNYIINKAYKFICEIHEIVSRHWNKSQTPHLEDTYLKDPYLENPKIKV